MRDFDNHFRQVSQRIDSAHRRQERASKLIGFAMGLFVLLWITVVISIIYVVVRVVMDPSLIGWAAAQVVSGFNGGTQP